MNKQDIINAMERVIKLIKADTGEKFTVDQLRYISEIFPDGFIDFEDEIVIYTGLKETIDGNICSQFVDEVKEND